MTGVLAAGSQRCCGSAVSGTWEEQALSLGLWDAIAFADASNGVVVGLGKIATTADGGDQWVLRNSPVDVQLRDVAAVDPAHAWIVGDEGTVLTTADGGKSFAAVSSGTLNQLFGVSFVDAHRGWVVGGAGTILATADGATFAHQVNGDPALYDLLDVVFVDANVGFAVGTAGTILKTTDGGANWVVQSSGGSTAQLFAVDFVNEDTGFAVGRDGTILSTSNGGQDWHAQSSGTSTAILLDVEFIDALRGWVVGTEDTILATTDGGATWEPQADPGGTPATENLSGVYFSDFNTGFICGSRILKYSPDAPPVLPLLPGLSIEGISKAENGLVLVNTDNPKVETAVKLTTVHADWAHGMVPQELHRQGMEWRFDNGDALFEVWDGEADARDRPTRPGSLNDSAYAWPNAEGTFTGATGAEVTLVARIRVGYKPVNVQLLIKSPHESILNPAAPVRVALDPEILLVSCN